MRRVFVAISKFVFNLLYRLFCVFSKREDMIVFLSRQANTPSYDFITLAREFEQRGWTSVLHVKKLSKRTALAYVGHVLREILLLSRCKAAVLDRYDPIISLIDFKCESPDSAAGILHHDFPVEPVILQLWHAFGAFKKFGYQSVGTREGHTREVTDVFNIHRNYSWVVCSGEGCRAAFAEAFACPIDRVVPLNRPEYDELVEERSRIAAHKNEALRVLMAPTLRKSKASRHPFRDLYERRNSFEEGIEADFTWSFHPLEDGLPAPGNVSSHLKNCDVVVTDYSSIVYEASLLGKQVLFYTPDMKDYLRSPGLNANPELLCPSLVMHSDDQLREAIIGLAENPASYDREALQSFCLSAFDETGDADTRATATRIADFVVARCR